MVRAGVRSGVPLWQIAAPLIIVQPLKALTGDNVLPSNGPKGSTGTANRSRELLVLLAAMSWCTRERHQAPISSRLALCGNPNAARRASSGGGPVTGAASGVSGSSRSSGSSIAKVTSGVPPALADCPEPPTRAATCAGISLIASKSVAVPTRGLWAVCVGSTLSASATTTTSGSSSGCCLLGKVDLHLLSESFKPF